MPSVAETVEIHFGTVARQDLEAMGACWKPGAERSIVGDSPS